MKLRPELAEVEEDLRTTDGLFGSGQGPIIEGLVVMNKYLGNLEREYVDNKSDADIQARDGESLGDSIGQLGLKRLEDFISQEPAHDDKPLTREDYLRALTDAKGAMRGHVFGPREDIPSR